MSRLGGLAPHLPTWTSSRRTLRDLGIGLAIILTVSFIPQDLSERFSEHPRRAVEICRDIRSLLFDVASDTITGVWDWLSALDLDTASDLLAGLIDGSWLGDRPGIPDSFTTAKQILYEDVYRGNRRTFYCDCRYDRAGRIDLDSCGLTVLRGSTRAERVEAEHVFPAAQFGRFRRCWREPASFAACRAETGSLLSGRDCCQRVDTVFITAHNDLHNLVPAVGAINAARSDFNWGELGPGQHLGDCRMRFDPVLRRVQPPDAVRGDIARIMLYMRDTYGLRLSRQDEQLYLAWHRLDPPDDWEIERNRRIRRTQGRGNPYVEGTVTR